MKCIQYFPEHIKNGVQYARVTDDKAAEEVSSVRAVYIPKQVWKEKVRDLGKEV